MFRIRHSNRVPAIDRGVNGEDSDEDVDGFERVGEGVRERSLFLTELPPREGFSVRRQDV